MHFMQSVLMTKGGIKAMEPSFSCSRTRHRARGKGGSERIAISPCTPSGKMLQQKSQPFMDGGNCEQVIVIQHQR